MKRILLIMIVIANSLLSYAQYASENEINMAIEKSRNSSVIDKKLFYGFYFGMDATQYTTVLNALVKNNQALEKDGTFLIKRNGKSNLIHFQALIPTFIQNRLTEITSLFIDEVLNMESLISDLEFENTRFIKYKYPSKIGDVYFLLKDNIMITTGIIEGKYNVNYIDNSIK